MTQQEEEKLIQKLTDRLTETISKRQEHQYNGWFRKVVIGVMVMVIAGGIGSFLGVRTAQKIDHERIEQNTANLKELERRTQKEFSAVETSIGKLQEEQLEQWKYIIDFANTRGLDSITNSK
jgi:hypothetical protein